MAFVVAHAVALARNALVGRIITSGIGRAAIIIEAEAGFCLAVVSLYITGLPAFTIPIKIASAINYSALSRGFIALFPCLTITVICTITRGRRAHVASWIAELIGWFALGI